MNKKFKKIIPVLVLCLLLLALVLPRNALAQNAVLNWLSCTLSPTSCAVYFITYVITTIMGFFVSVFAWLTQEALSFNQGVVGSPAVEKGFAVSLSIANLGFVIGIIVIAISTILRNQTYGVKQILWKLIVMAVLINFGLVIAGVILNLSDNFTAYFIHGASGDCDFNTGACFSGFVTKITQGFAPQALFKEPEITISDALGGNFFKGLLNMIFIVVFLFIISFTFLALAVMLLIRYVYITVLLILLPLAWVLWIFPQFSSNFSKWWHNFFRWTFFPPLVVFFLYLALLTAATKDKGNAGALGVTNKDYLKNLASQVALDANGGHGPVKSVIDLTGTSKADDSVLASAAQMIAVIGLSIGGLFAANSLSIAGAGVAMGAAKTVGGAAGKWTLKQGKKGGRAAFRGLGGEKLTERLQTGQLGALGRIPGVRRLAGITGRGLAGISDNKAMVEAAAKKVPDDKNRVLKELEGSMNTETQMAYLQKAQKEGWIKAGAMVNGKEITQSLQEDKAKFHSYGQDGEGKLEENLRDSTGLTLTELTAKKEKLDAKLGAAKRGTAATRLSMEDQKEYDETEEKINAYNKKMSAKNPDVLANAFQDHERARAKLAGEGKPIPITLQEESVKRMQAAILKTFAEGFSPNNARGLLDAIGKANNLKHFEAAVENMKKSDDPKEKEKFEAIKAALNTNKDLKRWMQQNAGRALFGNLRELFGLNPTKGEKKRAAGEGEDDEDNEEVT